MVVGQPEGEKSVVRSTSLQLQNLSLNPDAQQKASRFAARAGHRLARRYTSMSR